MAMPFLPLCVFFIKVLIFHLSRFPVGPDSKESACGAGGPSLIPEEDPLEKEMATHSSVLVWRISWTEEAGGLRPMGLQRVVCD